MLTRSGTMADVKIEDAGPGVEAAKLHRIFERYFSERPASHEALNATPPGHAGLGLWIVRRTVEALGGKVSAANCVGGGLSIHIALPLHQP
jgi:two-component system sensor histidine kinase ChvG